MKQSLPNSSSDPEVKKQSKRRTRQSQVQGDNTVEFVGDVGFDDDIGLSSSLGSIGGSVGAGSGTSITESEKEEENRREENNFALLYGRSEPISWHALQTHTPLFSGFDLELWWRRSDRKARSAVILTVLLLVLGILHLVAVIALIKDHFDNTVDSPYTCKTEACKNAKNWLGKDMNESIEPCDNFYEFICGKYEEVDGNELHYYEIVTGPAFKMEFGARSILAKILRNYEDKEFDQTVKFYRACVNEPLRSKYELQAYYGQVEVIFGTQNFSEFEETTRSMEEIGADVFRSMGQAVFINMAFYSYPYIQMIHPDRLLTQSDSGFSSSDSSFLVHLFEHIMGGLGVEKGSSTVIEMAEGIGVMRSIHNIIDTHTSSWTRSHLSSTTGVTEIREKLRGFCPPMGIKFDINKLFTLFLQEEYKFDYLDWWTEKYIFALNACLSEDPIKFTKTPTNLEKFNKPKTAFVAIWIVGLFYDFSAAMDEHMLERWEVLDEFKRSGYITNLKPLHWDYGIQHRCLNSLWHFLGYTPWLRFLASESNVKNPEEYIEHWEDVIQHFYEYIRNIFSEIPPTEIGYKQVLAGQRILQRRFEANALMPFAGGIIDVSLDKLNFTEDHLRNALLAVNYTVEKARNYWVGSTDYTPIMKWYLEDLELWGHGGPGSVRAELLDLHTPFIMAATLLMDSPDSTFATPTWKTFLGRVVPNYILFPLSIIDEPHFNESLALDSGAVTYKYLRSILNLIQESIPKVDYDSFNIGKSKTNRTDPSNRTCHRLQCYGPDWRNGSKEDLYKYTMRTSNVTDYTWTNNHQFLTLLALKKAFRYYRTKTKELEKIPASWTLPEQVRTFKMQKFLPGTQMSRFNEDQLFFITFVRHACRESWRRNKVEQEKRYETEAFMLSVLMQMEEFSQAFQCDKDSRMNNFGKDRCFQWVPQ